MKKLLCILALAICFVALPILTMAQPNPGEIWVVADPAPATSNITETCVEFDGADEGCKPYTESVYKDGNLYADMRRIDHEAVGTHDISVSYKNKWGQSAIIPFQFDVESTVDPSGIGLKQK